MPVQGSTFGSALQTALQAVRESSTKASVAANDILQAGLEFHNDSVSISDEAREFSQRLPKRENRPDMTTSFVKLSEASTAYKTNLAVLRTIDEMQREALRIGGR